MAQRQLMALQRPWAAGFRSTGSRQHSHRALGRPAAAAGQQPPPPQPGSSQEEVDLVALLGRLPADCPPEEKNAVQIDALVGGLHSLLAAMPVTYADEDEGEEGGEEWEAAKEAGGGAGAAASWAGDQAWRAFAAAGTLEAAAGLAASGAAPGPQADQPQQAAAPAAAASSSGFQRPSGLAGMAAAAAARGGGLGLPKRSQPAGSGSSSSSTATGSSAAVSANQLEHGVRPPAPQKQPVQAAGSEKLSTDRVVVIEWPRKYSNQVTFLE